MLEELYAVILWWAVLGSWLIHDTGIGDCIEFHADDIIEVKRVPKRFCAVVLACNVLPRTIICLWLTMLGADYLLVANSYSELIMNSLALTFLITVDELIY